MLIFYGHDDSLKETFRLLGEVGRFCHCQQMYTISILVTRLYYYCSIHWIQYFSSFCSLESILLVHYICSKLLILQEDIRRISERILKMEVTSKSVWLRDSESVPVTRQFLNQEILKLNSSNSFISIGKTKKHTNFNFISNL